ncbi:hypothetical protein ABEB36_004487 [Hypothenemus hampei]|uniref:Leucine-rich melanocyte differentiation-associated protein-like n=1 Tax=Hypothenemus hampei TaxID=57062 RepID=A0ABD1F3J2_HYPHA
MLEHVNFEEKIATTLIETTKRTKVHGENSTFPDIFELWKNEYEPESDIHEHSDILEVGEIVTKETLPNLLNNYFYSEIRTCDMTNFGDLLTGHSQIDDSYPHDDPCDRLSLAHEKLLSMPKYLQQEFGPSIKTLDITDNKIRNLDFLVEFRVLTSLIADCNPINSLETNIPWMPNLELLYLNRCNITDLHWVETLGYNCPKLKYLSLMGNPIEPTLTTTEKTYKYLQYRFYVISVVPTLIHLDDMKITDDERKEAKKMFPTQFIRRLYKSTRVRFPAYMRRIEGSFNHYFAPKSSRSTEQTNRIL